MTAAVSTQPVTQDTPTPIRNTQDDPFDLLSQSFRWGPGDIRTADPLAEHLRETQRLSGTAAVRVMVLDVLFRYALAGLPDATVARRLDVPPDLVTRWRAEQQRDQRSRLQLDPQDHLAKEWAELEHLARLCWQKLNAGVGAKAWNSAMMALARIQRRKDALLAQAGLAERMKLPPSKDQDDARGLGKVARLQGSLAAFMVAAGIDPNASFDQAVEELPGALDKVMGPVGTPEREEASRQLAAGFRPTKKP